ncbi:MAG TPA: carbon storage regulator [Ktedonobacterales bacterium]|nr:carbon storage regulator [Ktedonobacterales bacterium]
MLVVRRQPGDTLVINGEITVVLLAVEGDRVKLGITAPAAVTIVRGELLTAEGQERALRRKQEALEQETDPRQRERLEQGISRLQQSLTLAPASRKAR